MLEELRLLVEMQKALNKKIYRSSGVVGFPFEHTRLALIAEVGELIQELKPVWGYWKKHQNEVNWDAVLEEYVDCLHFAMSLFYFTNDELDHRYGFKDGSRSFISLSDMLSKVTDSNTSMSLFWLLRVGEKLGLKWEDIYSAYMKKNAVNYRRIREGY